MLSYFSENSPDAPSYLLKHAHDIDFSHSVQFLAHFCVQLVACSLVSTHERWITPHRDKN